MDFWETVKAIITSWAILAVAPFVLIILVVIIAGGFSAVSNELNRIKRNLAEKQERKQAEKKRREYNKQHGIKD